MTSSIRKRQVLTELDAYGEYKFVNPLEIKKGSLCRWAPGKSVGGDLMFIAGPNRLFGQRGLEDTGVVYQEKHFMCFSYMKRLSLNQYKSIIRRRVEKYGTTGDLMIR